MITVLFQMTVKAGYEARAETTAKEATASTKAEDRGCIDYRAALEAHVARLQRVYGPPDENEPYPPTHHRRRLPRAFLSLFERTEAVRYEAIG